MSAPTLVILPVKIMNNRQSSLKKLEIIRKTCLQQKLLKNINNSVGVNQFALSC